MQQANTFLTDMLDGIPGEDPSAASPIAPSPPAGSTLYRAALVERAQSVTSAAGPAVSLTVRFDPFKNTDAPSLIGTLVVRAMGDSIIRLTLDAEDIAAADHAGADSTLSRLEDLDASPMLALDPGLSPRPLTVREDDTRLELVDEAGGVRLRIARTMPPTKHWSDLVPGPPPLVDMTVLPDGQTPVPVMSRDTFFPHHIESVGLGLMLPPGFADRGQAPGLPENTEPAPPAALFSLHADANEHFVGTGERFARMDLAGRTMLLQNTDGLGNNSRRTYKNVPFYLSSRGYGLFMHTSATVRLSLADISTRAAQARIEDGLLDLFVIGGDGGPEAILRRYRQITGVPPELPMWSYGTWMARMTYFSAEEVREIARKLRDLDLPCDVLHLDTGWFAKDWVCEWKFSEERFPDPVGFMADMKDRGYRVTLWQNPSISKEACIYPEAVEKRFIPPIRRSERTGSDFSIVEYGGQIDFSNPDARHWYREDLIRPLLEMGAAAIKTDFGENIDMSGDYAGLHARLLRNRYALLYQQAAFEITQRVHGETQGIVWARAGWAGCQRYPVHWAGDTACTWDGMAAALRGGLHLGLSGFAYWSHDVPGFHGLPDFMNHWPADDLYVRWTQFGVFTSHLRYHGTSPREPYAYPAVVDTVRAYLKLRYALIPHLMDEARAAIDSGGPLLRAMLLHGPADPVCWTLDDQYLLGRSLLVAPVMNESGRRNVYLPAGRWVDVWTGERRGEPDRGTWLRHVHHPLERFPLFAAADAAVRIYPEPVACTDQMHPDRAIELRFDAAYAGLAKSTLGPLTGLG